MMKQIGFLAVLASLVFTGCNTANDPVKPQRCPTVPLDSDGQALPSESAPATGADVVFDYWTGEQTLEILLPIPLSEKTVNIINAYAADPFSLPIVVVRNHLDPISGLTNFKVYGYHVNDIFMASADESGVLYKLSGELVDETGTIMYEGLLGKDMIAFNAPYDPEVASDAELEVTYNAVAPNLWSDLMEWNKKMNYEITFVSGSAVSSYPESLNDWTVTRAVQRCEE